MLSRFRRPEADLQVEVNRDALHAGDELEARVALVPKSDFHVRSGKIELICTETYVQKISNQYGTSYHKKTEILSRSGETFISDETVRRSMPHSAKARLVAPPDALPSIEGAAVRSIQPGISWAVTASLDVARARDLLQSREITVVKRPALDDARHRPIVVEARHRQCVLALELPQGDARSGDRLDGSLRLEMLQDVIASEVRVELVRVEKFGNEGKDHIVYAATLEPDPGLKTGQTREWDFHLNVGTVRTPSLKTEKSSVRWLVKGIVSRWMRTDLRIEREIGVDF